MTRRGCGRAGPGDRIVPVPVDPGGCRSGALHQGAGKDGARAGLPRAHRPVRAAKVRISRQTWTGWIRDWRAGGFDALANPRQCTPAPRPRCWSWRWRCAENPSAPPRRSNGSCAPSWAGHPTNAPCNATSTDSASPAPRPQGRRRCSAGLRPSTRMTFGLEMRCTAYELVVRKRICSRSWMITPGCCPAIGGAMRRTRCGWPPRCARRWPPAASPRPCMSITDRPTSTVVVAGVRETRCAPGSFHTRPARREGQNREIL